MNLTFEVIMADASEMEQSKALELIAKLEDRGSGILSLPYYLEIRICETVIQDLEEFCVCSLPLEPGETFRYVRQHFSSRPLLEAESSQVSIHACNR